MVRKLLAAIGLILCFSAPVWADADGGDDTYYSAPIDCAQMCEDGVNCGAKCLPDDCVQQCENSSNFTEQLKVCWYDQFNSCEEYKECLCHTSDHDNNDDNSGGCAVSSGKPSVVLPIIMAALGLVALAISARKSHLHSRR